MVADSGDIESIRHYHPEDATTNPSLLLKAAGLASYSGLIDDAIAWAKKQGGGAKRRWLTPAISWRSILARRSSKVFPDGSPPRCARLSFNREKSIEKARHLVALYQEMGIDKSRILIKLASTWEGIAPRRCWRKRGIQLQPDVAVFLRPGPGLRRGRGLSHLPVRWAYL